jgi:hypothetical protein
MPASERQAGHVLGSASGGIDRDGLSSRTRAAELTPTAAWSRRVRWIGGLIQTAIVLWRVEQAGAGTATVSASAGVQL